MAAGPQRIRRSAALCLLLLLSACGYVGEPLPPALNIPEKITDLRAVQRGPNIVLEFTIPALTTEGLPITTATVELRAGTAAGSEFNTATWEASGKPYTTEGAQPGYYKVEIPSADWTGKEVVFSVRVHHPRGRFSDWSNFVVLPVIPEVAVPSDLRAESIAPGVRVTWRAAQPDLSFKIYRRESSETVPVQIGTRAGSSEFVDPAVQYGKTYEYSVQAVRQAGDGEAESLVSAPVQVSREDRFAPAVPRGLTAVAGTHSVELAWTPSPETDLAGYRVYRAIEGGKFERLAELIEVPSFSDRSAERGKRYSYAVTSIDQLGNESDRSEPLEIVAQ